MYFLLGYIELPRTCQMNSYIIHIKNTNGSYVWKILLFKDINIL